MPISVKQQAALGLTGTAVVATGGTLIYKNSISKTSETEFGTKETEIQSLNTQTQGSSKFFAIEQLAIDTENWKIEKPEKVISSDPEAWRVVASIQRDDLEAGKYEATSGSWTCEILISSATSSDDTFIKKALNSYFSGYSIDNPTNPLKIEKLNREIFVEKCSNHRKENSNNNTVNAQVTVSVNQLAENLKTVLGEFPLFQTEKEAITVDSWSIKSSSSQSGLTKTFTIKVESPNKSWSCSVMASATANSVSFDGIKKDLKSKFNVDVEDNGSEVSANSITKENKEGFLKSCARNRKPNLSHSDSKVESEFKLDLFSEDTDQVYKFRSGDLENLFKGVLINFAA